jgi:four helix bundle protein
MLEIQSFIIDTLVVVKPLVGRIERGDRDLARQIRRAASSIALNVAEGEFSRGRNQAARFHTALGSANETLVGLEVAVALGYLESVDPATIERMRRIIGTLVKLVRSAG